MPYKIVKQGKYYYVKKRLTGTTVGRTTSKAKAESMIRAIESSEHRKGK